MYRATVVCVHLLCKKLELKENFTEPIFVRLSKVNKILKLISIEHVIYGAASNSSGKGQHFFCKKLFYNHM